MKVKVGVISYSQGFRAGGRVIFGDACEKVVWASVPELRLWLKCDDWTLAELIAKVLEKHGFRIGISGANRWGSYVELTTDKLDLQGLLAKVRELTEEGLLTPSITEEALVKACVSEKLRGS